MNDYDSAEKAFEEAKAKRFHTKKMWEAARAKYHVQLIARREAGQRLTQGDIKALLDDALNTHDEIRDAYLKFIEADGEYRKAKIVERQAYRDYWSKKDELRFRA